MGRSLRKATTSPIQKLKHTLQNWVVTKVKKYDPLALVAATIVFEGSKEEVTAQKKVIARILKKHNGIFGGAEKWSTWLFAYLCYCVY